MKTRGNYNKFCNAMKKYTLFMKKYTLLMIYSSVMTLLGFLNWAELSSANETQLLQWGTFITESDIWNKKQIGMEFSPEQAIELKLADKTVMFYHDKTSWEALLLIFNHDQPRILWKTDWLLPSGHIPDPILAAGLLNANHEPDLVFCLSIDRGIGQSAEHWNQDMYLFIDSQKTIEEPIPLSVVDISLCDSDQADCRAVWDRRNALVLVVSASEDTPGTIYVWSQRYRSEDQPLGATERMYTYQIVEYQIKEDQLVHVETTEGSRLQTSELLRSIIWTRREQGNEPLLLNFASSPYLFDENTWFNFFTYRE